MVGVCRGISWGAMCGNAVHIQILEKVIFLLAEGNWVIITEQEWQLLFNSIQLVSQFLAIALSS